MWFKNILRRNRAAGRVTQRAAKSPTSRAQFKVDEVLLRRLERLNLQSHRSLVGNPNSGEHPSRQQLPTTIFSDHRPYSHGDDYRSIDWNAYARHEQVVVKLGEAEQDINVHLLLDCSRSMAWGQPSKMVTAQHLLAAIGYIALAHSDRLRITPFGNAILPGFGPSQGKGRTLDMLRFLAAAQPKEPTALTRPLHAYARQHERGGLLVLCSDLLGAPEEVLDEALRAFTPPRWQVLVLHVLDPRELEPDLNGPLELEDAETGQRLPLTLDAETLSAYKRNVTQWQERIAQTCVRRGVTYAQVLTDWPMERSVVPYLRMRRVLQ
jgi:uncharacterized protein (DUF58 family)